MLSHVATEPFHVLSVVALVSLTVLGGLWALRWLRRR